ncbi:M48 family metallopeptidase [Aquimarina rhabdastrellae]
MSASTLFYILLIIIIIVHFIDSILDVFNAKHFSKKIPHELADVYPKDEYQKSIAYKKVNFKFKLITSSISLFTMLAFLAFDGFALLDNFVRTFSNNDILVGLLFFGFIIIGGEIISLPSSYYQIFVIEEQFGFNKMSLKTFFVDKLKNLLMLMLLGGSILAAIIWFYNFTGPSFWLYAWGLVIIFSLLMNMFYARFIVPLFNKQTPLEEGELRTHIQVYAEKVGFKLNNIFVIDGSKRSTKANAYFSGLGSEKRITLYDTLIKDLEVDEIVAVLAHEVGHYKKRHIIYNLILSILLTGFTLWLLSIFINSPLLAEALGVSQPSFHIGLIAFGILYTPITEITGLFMNMVSRTFEYQADNYAKNTFNAPALIRSLKKLSKNSLSNLTPHPAYVFMHYSHPTLLQRIKNLEQ